MKSGGTPKKKSGTAYGASVRLHFAANQMRLWNWVNMIVSHQIKWNNTKQEWFCVRCLRTSDHIGKEDAERELSQFECSQPAEYTEFS